MGYKFQIPILNREDIAKLSYQESHTSLKAMIIFFGLLFFVAIFGSLLCGVWYGHFTTRSTQLAGIETTALLEEKFIDDSRQRSYWFTYRFTTLSDDTYLSSVKVNETTYNQYHVGSQLLLRYQANNPTFNSLEILHTDLNTSLWSAFEYACSLPLGISLLRLMSPS